MGGPVRVFSAITSRLERSDLSVLFCLVDLHPCSAFGSRLTTGPDENALFEFGAPPHPVVFFVYMYTVLGCFRALA